MIYEEDLFPSGNSAKDLDKVDTLSYYLLDSTSSGQSEWMSNIIGLQSRLSHFIQQLIETERCRLEQPHIVPLEGKTEIYKILDHVRTQKNRQDLSFTFFASHLSAETGKLSSESQELSYIEELKKSGYQHVTEKIKNHQGYPWNAIKTIHHPLLFNQLVDLALLCEMKGLLRQKHAEKRLIDFALNLAKVATSPNLSEHYPHSQEAIESTKRILGQLIYLINCHPQGALKCTNLTTTQGAINKIQQEFDGAINKLAENLQTHYLSHCETLLQSPAIAFHTKIPSELAKILLTDLGTLNIGIIDILADKFLTTAPLFNHQINLAYGLQFLQRSPHFRAEFEKIQRPLSPDMPSNDVIRAALELSPDTSITDLHAKQTVLTALLSHLRQGKTGSCFATSLASEILSSHLDFCLKDLSQLIRESKLTRTIKGVRKDIPFIKAIPDENLAQKIVIDHKGIVLSAESPNKQEYIWDAPGIKAACLAIEIPDIKKAIGVIFKQSHTEKTHEIEVKELLKQLCEYAVTLHPHKKNMIGLLYAQACFTFSSQTAQPLLKVWENAIANMAEAQEGSMVKTNILEAISYALQFRLGELNVPPSNLIRDLLQQIKQNLYTRIQLQYDPSVGSVLDERQFKGKGGFVLYDKDQRIDTKEAFVKFIAEILFQVSKGFRRQPIKPEDIQAFTQFFTILVPYLNSEEFSTKLLTAYHPSNASQLIIEPHQYQKLKYTPWITQIGNNSKTVLEVYLETKEPIQTEHLLSKNLEDRLLNLIKIGQKMIERERDSYELNPHKSTQIRIPGWHTGCLILLANPNLLATLNQQHPVEQWIEEFVKMPGREVAESLIDSTTRERLIKAVTEDILPAFLPKEKILIFSQIAKNLPEPISIKDYRTTLIKLCCESSDLTPSFTIDKVIRQLDTAVYESLEPHLKKQLESSTMHIIDTNWSHDVHDIHLCAVVNPGTGELELWEAYSNSSHLKAIDQKDWLQEWEILLLPENLLTNRQKPTL